MIKTTNRELDHESSEPNIVLGIRTDTAEATILLYCHPEEEAPIQSGHSYHSEPAPDSIRGSLNHEGTTDIIDQITWAAGRQLSATLLSKIDELLIRNKKTWSDLSGIVVYQGPGSFTGLRISITVANTAAFILNIPIIGATGDDWLEWGSERLNAKEFNSIVMPFYGAEANITKPKGTFNI